VVEFGLGIWWRRFGVDVVAGLEVFFGHVNIAAGGHFGLISPHFIDVSIRLAYGFSAFNFSILPSKW